ncbi:uncharacterized protein LOC108676617 [Hyalella azteca]|uniref:Uncharacterized protein LOC108676617 n=1 Tax=Hyalella azteca TaxID=294128 RepID=A0A8B7P2G5_HYAAZ|nr:uncharacterized protein LOC108676617 [Hyalella azteca]XP_018020218.1 uncharacterized protein LOC108676617 [Hyalella azteca]
MQPRTTSSAVWQRRTNRTIAAGIIIIGLTMMLSNITQCIYIGMLFIVVALVWLAWMTIKERKIVPASAVDQQSPVLFLVTSHMLPNLNHPAVSSSSDKPPSYDTVLGLDDQPPDYSSVIPEKPPRYEDAFIAPHCSTSPSGSSWDKEQMIMMENSLDVSRDSNELSHFIRSSAVRDSLLIAKGYSGSGSSSMLSRAAQACGARASGGRCSSKSDDYKQTKSSLRKKFGNNNRDSHRSRAPNSSPISRRHFSSCVPLPSRTRHHSSTASDWNLSASSCKDHNSSGSRSLPRLLQLQAPTLSQDTARRLTNCFSRTSRDVAAGDEEEGAMARVHQTRTPSRPFLYPWPNTECDDAYTQVRRY